MMGAADDDGNINPRYLNAINRFTREEIDAANKAADHCCYQIGVNVIPADTKIKKAWILKSWEDYKTNPIPLETYAYWKQKGLFAHGIAAIMGKVWRGQNTGKYLNLIDADNGLAIEKICTRDGKSIPLQELAEWTLVEQHKDDPKSAHIYIISTRPFPIKASDKGKPDTANKIETNEIPGIEVKNVGGLSFVCNSVHENGCRYEFVNTDTPVQCDDFHLQINQICKEFGLKYLDENGRGIGEIPIRDLFNSNTVIYAGNNRHKQLLRVCDSLIKRLKDIMPLDQIKDFVIRCNRGKNFSEPLEDKDVEKIWKQALGFIVRNEEDSNNNNQPPLELSISEALRIKCGYIKVKGQLIGQSTVYGMISAIGNVTCCNCGTLNLGKDYKKPDLSLKSELKNRKCLNCEEPISTESAQKYNATVDVELQDPDRFSEIERLSVHLFEKNTENIQVGEVVTIVGRIYMERKNDNGHNRPTPILYGETIEYTRKEQSKLSEKDIEDIQKWKALKEMAGINPIDALVEMFGRRNHLLPLIVWHCVHISYTYEALVQSIYGILRFHSKSISLTAFLFSFSHFQNGVSLIWKGAQKYWAPGYSRLHCIVPRIWKDPKVSRI